MIFEFLKMEFNSDRHAKKINDVLESLSVNSKIITDGNIMSEHDNALRAEVLRHFRGWRNQGLFENFPLKIDWIWTVFEREDLQKIRYVNYSYWNVLSNYTGSPIEAAKTIYAGKTVYGVPNDGAVCGSEKLRNGHDFPPLIFLTDENESRYIILEGHCRMTAYGLVPDLFQNVSVLLGFCRRDELDRWYGKMPDHPA